MMGEENLIPTEKLLNAAAVLFKKKPLHQTRSQVLRLRLNVQLLYDFDTNGIKFLQVHMTVQVLH